MSVAFLQPEIQSAIDWLLCNGFMWGTYFCRSTYKHDVVVVIKIGAYIHRLFYMSVYAIWEEKTKPEQPFHLLLCKLFEVVASSFTRYKPLRLLQTCINKKTILPVRTLEEQLDHLKVDTRHWLRSKVQRFICDWPGGMRVIHRTKIHTHTQTWVATHNVTPTLRLQPDPRPSATCTKWAKLTHRTTLWWASALPATCTHLAATSLMKRSALQFSASSRYKMRIAIQRDVAFVNGRAKQASSIWVRQSRKEHLHTHAISETFCNCACVIKPGHVTITKKLSRRWKLACVIAWETTMFIIMVLDALMPFFFCKCSDFSAWLLSVDVQIDVSGYYL